MKVVSGFRAKGKKEGPEMKAHGKEVKIGGSYAFLSDFFCLEGEAGRFWAREA